MECWSIGPGGWRSILSGFPETKIKILSAFIAHYSSIPALHYSMGMRMHSLLTKPGFLCLLDQKMSINTGQGRYVS